MNPAPHWYRDTRSLKGFQRVLVTVAAPNPLVAAWRWRYEIALLSGLSAGLAAAIVFLGTVPTIVAVIVITLAILCWRRAQQFAVNRAWCIITPHRVRVGCAEGLIYSSRGKIPVILWTSSQVYGERVVLWCRAGANVDDFVSARAILAAACWAQDVAIFSDVRHAHLVTLDVIRRPPIPVSDSDGRSSSDPSERPPSWPGDRGGM